MSRYLQPVPLTVRGQRRRLFLPRLGQLILLAVGINFPARTIAADPALQPVPLTTITNVGQFRTLSGEDLRKFPFHLTGTVTLADRERNLLVLQDKTGAVAVDLELTNISVQPGQQISMEGAAAFPYVNSFPSYPYRPSGWDLQPSFEAPKNWGDYHLTRMRGYLRPPVTGDYVFWIASDNSSELWLSSNEDPANGKKIASVKQGDWVDPHEWSRYPSQRSEAITLSAGHTYYIEAFQEQTILADHLSVAWKGPGLGQAVIDGHYLTPWIENAGQTQFSGTNGILREYWTNYSAGGLSGITGTKRFESAITAKEIHVTVLSEPGVLPAPCVIVLGQPLRPEDDYRWAEIEGTVSFAAADAESAILEVNDGPAQARVRLATRNQTWVRHIQNERIRIHGVCEGAYDAKRQLVPGLIWVPTENDIQIVESPATNLNTLATSSSDHGATPADTNVLGGYYYTHGVVTFNDRVFDRNCIFIQDENGGIFVAQAERSIGPRFQVGQLVEIGGYLLPGKYAPHLHLLFVTTLGWGVMPEPTPGPTDIAVAENRDNRWTEVEGVVHSVNTNGTVEVVGRKGAVSIWIGRVSTDDLKSYVDSTLRIRGVMSLSTFDQPELLVPSRDFVEVKETAPENPFLIPSRRAAKLQEPDTDSSWIHRTKVEGVITYQGEGQLFVQDNSGGVDVQTTSGLSLRIGDRVAAVGFPEVIGSCPALTEALVQRTGTAASPAPRKLDHIELVAGKDAGTLIQVKGNLITQKSKGRNQILELQDGQHIFEAVLTKDQSQWPSLIVGSRLQMTGICIINPNSSPATRDSLGGDPAIASVQIWLRVPDDIRVLAGPPWWNWQRAAVLVGILLAVLTGTSLWIYLLRRRLERQRATQLAFSRQNLLSQENERRRIAGNLHDSLGQNLLVIKNQTRLAMQPADESVLRQRLNEISEMASRSLEEVRQITHDLRPYQLDRLGLTQAIRAIVNRVSENSQILFASHVDDIDGLFDKESEIHVYRMVQEGINNIIKHSGANEAVLVIKKDTTTVAISIRDNGRGFTDPPVDSPAPPDRGFGLSGISERIKILNGKLTVDSRAGQGVNLALEIPLPPAQHGT